jgi:hypothetical protein
VKDAAVAGVYYDSVDELRSGWESSTPEVFQLLLEHEVVLVDVVVDTLEQTGARAQRANRPAQTTTTQRSSPAKGHK